MPSCDALCRRRQPVELEEMKMTKNYTLSVNGEDTKIQPTRVSRFPLNRSWPGQQRPLEQTEVTGFASFVPEYPAQIEIKCDFDFSEVVVRPLSLGIIPEIIGNTVSFRLDAPCQAVVEFDGIAGALHLFAEPEREEFTPDEHTVYFGPGEHDAGRIVLHSGETVYIHRDAVVYGEIYAEDVHDVTVMGGGILDHSKAEAVITDDVDFIDPPRPSPIEIRYSENVTLRDIIIRDPCFLAVRPICCENVRIDRIKIIGCWRYNSDGIDLLNCRHAEVTNCFVRSFDDSLCIKGFCTPFVGQMNHGGRVYDIAEDITFRNCIVFNGWGKALEIGVDLCAREVRNCRFIDCDVIHATHAAMDISNVDYADVHGILFENIRVEYGEKGTPPIFQSSDDVTYPGDSADFMPYLMLAKVYYFKAYSFPGERRGRIRDVIFRNIRVTAPRMPESVIEGYSDEYAVENLAVDGVFLNGKKITSPADAGITVGAFAKSISFESASGREEIRI